MKALVACPIRLLQVDLDSSEIGLLESDRSEYYGVSWPYSGRELCLSHSGQDHATINTLESYIDSEVGWLSLGARTGPIGLSAPHQIVCTDAHVVATNTGRNCVTVFQQDNFFSRNYWFDDVRWDRKGTHNCCGSHLNSVYLHNQRLYVVAHNFDRGSDVLELRWPDMKLVKRYRTTALAAHNVWVTDDQRLIICDTMRGALIDARSNEVLWKCEEPNAMTRGLACDDKHVYIGRSEQSDRRGRRESDGGIWIVDYKRWKTRDYIHLPGIGNVMEVRLLGVPDSCHHGRAFRASIETEPYTPNQEQPAALAFRCEAGATAQDWCEHGNPVATDGEMVFAPNATLATRRCIRAADIKVSATVDLDRSDSYSGVVARYRGPGDTNMLVAMLHRERERTTVELWSQRNNRWTCLGAKLTPLARGTIELTCLDSFVQVAFDGEVAVQEQCEGHSAGSVGFRVNAGRVGNFRFDPQRMPGEATGDAA